VEGDAAAEEKDQDVAYAYLWYAPATVRIVERALGGGQTGGAAWDAPSVLGVPGVDCGTAPSAEIAEARPCQRIVVVFLGGCTRCEIAAVRMIAKKQGIAITIATTAVITGTDLVDAFRDDGAGFSAEL
jgi:hypothetical protein